MALSQVQALVMEAPMLKPFLASLATSGTSDSAKGSSSTMRRALLIAMPLVVLLPACATLQDTPAQARAREEWRQCEGSFPGVMVKRVEPDGRTWFSAPSAAGLAGAQACIASVRAQNPRPGQAASPVARAEPPRRADALKATALAEPPRRQADVESSVWAYTAVSETMASFNVVAYAANKIDCEASRARDLYGLEGDNRWLKAKLDECRPALVSGGTNFWTFDVNQNRISYGATTQDMCVWLHDEMRKQAPGPATECRPVSVRFQGKP